MDFKVALKEILIIKGESALTDKSTTTLLEDYGAFDEYNVFSQIWGTIIEMGIGNVLLNIFCQSIIDDKGVAWNNLKSTLSNELPYDEMFMHLFFENLEHALLGYITENGNIDRGIKIAAEESLGRIWTDDKGGKYSLDKKILYDASETKGFYLIDSNNEEVCPCAFRQNNKITDIRFSKNLKTIGSCAFQNCSKMSKVHFNNNDVTTIGEYAFGGCFSLEEVYLPGKIHEISEGLFSVCTNLLYVHMPKSVKTIGKHAFHDCHSLQFAVIPDDVTSIGDDAFHHCISLSYIVLPLGLTSVGERVFDSCRSLRDIYIPEGTTSKFTCLLPNYSQYFKEYSYGKCLYSGIVDEYNVFITRSGEIIVRNRYPLRKECDILEINNYKKGYSRKGTFIYKENEHRYYLSPILKYKSAEEIIAMGDSITVADITINNGKDWMLYAYFPLYESFDTIYNTMPSEWFYESKGHSMPPHILQSGIDNYVIDEYGDAYSKDMK